MAPSFDIDSIVFLDIEASGLGPTSFPIEVGWAFLTGGSGALLIKPEANWHLSCWDEVAEALHGLTLQRLQCEGYPARDVAEALNQLLGHPPPFLVLSDAPAADCAWLRCLYEATPEGQAFELQDEARARQRLLDTHGTATRRRRLPDRLRGKPAHRARPDACRLAAIWRAHLELSPVP